MEGKDKVPCSKLLRGKIGQIDLGERIYYALVLLNFSTTSLSLRAPPNPPRWLKMPNPCLRVGASPPQPRLKCRLHPTSSSPYSLPASPPLSSFHPHFLNQLHHPSPQHRQQEELHLVGALMITTQQVAASFPHFICTGTARPTLAANRSRRLTTSSKCTFEVRERGLEISG